MLDRLQPRPGARRPRKRVGRGPGSGLHKTSGRGQKGQGKRSPGRETPLQFEGGQMPLVRRLPKRGFFNRERVAYQIVNVGALSVFKAGSTVDTAALLERGLIRRNGGGVKILAQGEAPKKLALKFRISLGSRNSVTGSCSPSGCWPSTGWAHSWSRRVSTPT
jgi:large subunit ribosomal protein L15